MSVPCSIHHEFIRNGFDRNGTQRVRCKHCGITRLDYSDSLKRTRLGEQKELQITRMILSGASVREIAFEVGVSSGTVLSRRAGLIETSINDPVSSKNGCHYCGKRLTVSKELDRRTSRTKHKFCDNKCYQSFYLVTNENRLTNYLYRRIINGKIQG